MKKFVWTGLALLSFASIAGAQLRGMGRISGTVSDESGAPLSGVTVKAKLPALSSTGSLDATSDDKGGWNVGGMAKGEWDVVFEKAGYAPRHAKVILPVELARVPPITITLKKN